MNIHLKHALHNIKLNLKLNILFFILFVSISIVPFPESGLGKCATKIKYV